MLRIYTINSRGSSEFGLFGMAFRAFFFWRGVLEPGELGFVGLGIGGFGPNSINPKPQDPEH